jgi:hypothetical protein
MMKEADHLGKVKRVRIQDTDLEPWTEAYTVRLLFQLCALIRYLIDTGITGCTVKAEGAVWPLKLKTVVRYTAIESLLRTHSVIRTKLKDQAGQAPQNPLSYLNQILGPLLDEKCMSRH